MLQPVITRLQEISAELPDQLAQFSAEEMAHRPAPCKWSKKEILGHLADSALHNLQRFCYAQLSGGLYAFERYPQDDLVRLNNYQNLPAEQIVALWASLNRQIVAVLEAMPENILGKFVRLPDGETATLHWHIEDYLDHMEHHLRQILPQD